MCIMPKAKTPPAADAAAPSKRRPLAKRTMFRSLPKAPSLRDLARCLPQAEETVRENGVRFMRPNCATDNQALNEYDASMTQIFKIGLQFAPKSGTIGR